MNKLIDTVYLYKLPHTNLQKTSRLVKNIVSKFHYKYSQIFKVNP